MTDREQFRDVQIRGLDWKAALIRDDASQLCNYVRTLTSMRDNDDTVRGSIAGARLALTEALLAVRLAEEEYGKVNRVLQAAE